MPEEILQHKVDIPEMESPLPFLKQIKDIENGYVVKDVIEKGILNIIPLWQLRFTY